VQLPVSRLPERPKIPERFSVIPVGADEFRLHSLTYSLSISNKADSLLSHLLPLLTGEYRVTDILRKLETFDEARVIAVLDHLMHAGVLEEGLRTQDAALSAEEVDRYRDQLLFFSHFAASEVEETGYHGIAIPTDSLEYQERLKLGRVAVFGLGRLGSQLVRQLTSAGVGRILGVDDGYVSDVEVRSDAWFESHHVDLKRCDALQSLVTRTNPRVEFIQYPQPVDEPAELVDILSESDFAVFNTDQFKPDQYDAFNLACLQSGTPWTSCRLVGFELNIGPTVVPYETPCYKCFDVRQKSNLTDYEEYLIVEAYLRSHELDSGALAITPGTGLVALEVIKALTHFVEPALYGHLFSLNLLSLECKRHPILKIPRCPHCGRRAQGRPTIQMWQQ
jgi:bacteriocin biosynthesis cyclodehydratase domain-containing protein